MSRVRTFFLKEATEYLTELKSAVESEPMEVRAAYRAARRLRGSAQMARLGALARAARGLEGRLRTELGTGVSAGMEGVPPSPEVRGAVRRVVASLEQGVAAVRAGRMVEDPRQDPRQEVEMDEQVSGGASESIPLVSIDALEYRGEAALERALSLRKPLESAIVADQPAGPILDELFDLIRLGAK